MPKRQFYWQWTKRAFTRPLLWVSLFAGFFAIVGGAVVYGWPQLWGTVNFLLWAIPLAVFVASVIVGFLLAPYHMQRETEQECDKLREQLGSTQRKKEIADVLSGFYRQGGQLLTKQVNNDLEFEEWCNEEDAWKTRLLDHVHGISVPDATRLSTFVTHAKPRWKLAYNDTHNSKLHQVHQRMQTLDEIIRRYQA